MSSLVAVNIEGFHVRHRDDGESKSYALNLGKQFFNLVQAQRSCTYVYRYMHMGMTEFVAIEKKRPVHRCEGQGNRYPDVLLTFIANNALRPRMSTIWLITFLPKKLNSRELT